MRLLYMLQEQANQKVFRHQTQEEPVRDDPMFGLNRIVYFIHQKWELLLF